MYDQAVEIGAEEPQASISLVQPMVLVGAALQARRPGGMESRDFPAAVGSARADFTHGGDHASCDGQAARTKTSTGSFEFQRPGRFRCGLPKALRPDHRRRRTDGRWLY